MILPIDFRMQLRSTKESDCPQAKLKANQESLDITEFTIESQCEISCRGGRWPRHLIETNKLRGSMLGKIREPQTNDQQRWCDVRLVKRPALARGVTTVICDVDGIVESALS